jgi:hypothetical protein
VGTVQISAWSGGRATTGAGVAGFAAGFVDAVACTDADGAENFMTLPTLYPWKLHTSSKMDGGAKFERKLIAHGRMAHIAVIKV